VTENEVELIVTEGELNGSLDHEQSEMIRNVLEFGDLTAGEIMVPRTRIVSFDLHTSGQDVLRTVAETEHSRYPIYRERVDNIVGILHVKDVVSFVAKNDVKTLKLADIMRAPVTFVPESQLASSVLKCMRAERHHMAIVLDEFGGIAGLVTLEDLIEEIVGDIRDEHDVEEPPIVDMGDGRLMVDAGVSMVDLGRYLGRELPDDGDYNSLGGFLVARLGRVPAAGVKLKAFDLDFVVREADERHIARVEIVRPADQVSPLSTRPSSMSAA
jgi:CBS domain containing-hemolysin-like protein